VINISSKIYVAGHAGLVGSAVLRKLKLLGFKNIITVSKSDLDLSKQTKVLEFFKKTKPDYVILAAAKVGGILVNNLKRADFIYDNLSIQNNVIHSSYLNKVKGLIFLGSSCIYPRDSKQPIKESYLLTKELEYTNEPYAIAKIAGVKLCEAYNFQYQTNYKCLMPTNCFGPGDNYDLKSGHFLPALISKIHQAKIKNTGFINLWGDGKSLREVIYVDDLADSIIYFLNKKTKHSLINIGTGIERTIKEFANILCEVIGVKLKIKYINKKLIGTPRKILDTSLAKKYGWNSGTNLLRDLALTYQAFLKKNN
jgi:GDP-L-fucose synthase